MAKLKLSRMGASGPNPPAECKTLRFDSFQSVADFAARTQLPNGQYFLLNLAAPRPYNPAALREVTVSENGQRIRVECVWPRIRVLFLRGKNGA